MFSAPPHQEFTLAALAFATPMSILSRMSTHLIIPISFLAAAIAGQADTAISESTVLSTLRPSHPRLIVLDDELDRVRRMIETDPVVRKLRDEERLAAEKMLDEPTVVHRLIGPRLLYQSRLCVQRVYTLAAMYRLEGDRRFAARAEKEMLAAAAFPDWNPRHFLDTAEMSHALGVGYDWLYDVLSPDSRRTIRTALIEKGLKPGLELYRKNRWPVNCEHNWNQVCNGGLTIGALAIADEEPELAARIIANASRLIRKPTARLAPDGGWDEGPGYWNYAMSYTAYYLAAVRTALATDFGLSAMPGLADTALFRIHSIGPIKQTFNYADAGSRAGNAPQMFFFARLFDRPVYAWHQRRFRSGTSALDLLWYDPRGTDVGGTSLPLDAHFKNVDVVFLRSAWNDPNALFVGFKGGDNRANHSHLDLGTFVFDALGKRWAIDIGSDDYNLPGYFGKKRWTYYRLQTQGQNTLVINGQNQDPKARAPVIACESSPTRSFAIADLTAAYAEHAKRVHRGIALLDRKRVLVQDEIEADAPLSVEWMMHTRAAVELSSDLATLSQGGKQLRARLIEPPGAIWHVQAVEPKPPQRPLENVRKLIVRLSTKPPETRITVLLTPLPDARPDESAPLSRPLSGW